MRCQTPPRPSEARARASARESRRGMHSVALMREDRHRQNATASVPVEAAARRPPGADPPAGWSGSGRVAPGSKARRTNVRRPAARFGAAHVEAGRDPAQAPVRDAGFDGGSARGRWIGDDQPAGAARLEGAHEPVRIHEADVVHAPAIVTACQRVHPVVERHREHRRGRGQEGPMVGGGSAERDDPGVALGERELAHVGRRARRREGERDAGLPEVRARAEAGEDGDDDGLGQRRDRAREQRRKEEDEARRPRVVLHQQQHGAEGQHVRSGREAPALVSPGQERERGEPQQTQRPSPPRLILQIRVRDFPERRESRTEDRRHVAREIRRAGPPAVDGPADRGPLGVRRPAGADRVEGIAELDRVAQVPVAARQARESDQGDGPRAREIERRPAPGGNRQNDDPGCREEHGRLDPGAEQEGRRGEHDSAP